MNKHKKIIFIYGPTASGKTDVASVLAQHIPIEIINMDSAQCYSPLRIGTAKPDWQNSAYPQHLFDMVSKPYDLTAHLYRQRALHLIDEICKRGNYPVFVGGSGFYLASLIFPPKENTTIPMSQDGVYTWDQLYAIDTDRAEQIHPHDTYRIKRALDIWYATGQKPSLYKPAYDPPGSFIIMRVTRNRINLYDRINKRTESMLAAGWLEEAKSIMNSPWESFIREKGFIGYAELFDYERGIISFEKAISTIQQKTRNYAKKQEIFWRMLKKRIDSIIKDHHFEGYIMECDLTSTDLTLYIKQLLQLLK